MNLDTGSGFGFRLGGFRLHSQIGAPSERWCCGGTYYKGMLKRSQGRSVLGLLEEPNIHNSNASVL